MDQADLREQSSQIFAWAAILSEDDARQLGLAGMDTQGIFVVNASQLPIYDVVLSLVLIRGAGPHTGEQLVALGPEVADRDRVVRSVLPPGRWFVSFPNSSWGARSSMPGGEIAFNDSAETSWVRRVSGSLEQLSQNPLDALSVNRPFPEARLENLDPNRIQ